MAKDLEHIKVILTEALEKETETERKAYLDEACRNNVKLRAEVESLLRSHDNAGDFLEASPFGPDITFDESPLKEGPGTVIGRYKLLEKIGEGGMAVVYMAEQTEPIRRKVALKIIKLGMDTKSVIARFEAERQALVMMDHPNITKFFDAGATETGRPYFVMELVTGVSITEYCDKNNLSTKERLALFIQVCNAVQHAHQKGIIHRDIKPTNVMVSRHESQPIPKVIDFGIAKATNQRLTEKTLFTRYAHIVGTPAYMSPEQADLGDTDVDTRSDIYSLGVLLYELLTGTTPFSEEELRKVGYIEMQHIIREKEPAKPSTKLSTLGETLADVAKNRSVTPDILRKTIHGDLDWIVMKSLEKDRNHRYETANMLALDILRHLEHEPVMAGAPGTTYRMQKFLRRHRSQAIAILAILIIAVAVVTILSMWNQDRLQLVEAEGFGHSGILSQAREQYAKAEREAALETIKPILSSKHVGPETQLLQAGILIDNRRSDEAVTILIGLLDERPEIAGAAHSLLARILWESESPNAERLKEIEEHRRKAEALLPETAEAYFLRAMTAVTVKEQFASLDRALQLDPGHYESRRLRAFTYYASRKYEKMKEDALVMAVLRPRDPMGYSLRAIALRELKKFTEAIVEYDRAIALTAKGSPQYIELSTQRCETLLRMGDYERVISDAEACLKLSPDKPDFQYYIFCARTALGDYDEATALFHQVISPGHKARKQFQEWCMKYVFDTLDAGRSWHPQDREPAGAAFLPMVEAEETYLELSSKARRLVTDGFTAHWSPDRKKLAFSLGVHGYSGVAVFDPATKETDLLIVPGKDPLWSPDGNYIAFIRDCQLLRLEELATAENNPQHRPVTDEEVWIMKSDGTEPRLLARGSWPSWGRDSEHIYYQSRVDNVLYSISIVDQNAETKRIMKCSNSLVSVSPDNQRVSYFEAGKLKIKDLASQETVAESRMPSMTWGVTGWSPTGNEVCLGGGNPNRDNTSLWLYNLQSKDFLSILDGQITATCWSPTATELSFCLGKPYLEIWVADLDPNVQTAESLGPGQTLDEHLRDMVAFYTRRIETDPNDAYAYSGRAHYYDCLRNKTKATADMRRWSAILSGADLQVATPRNVRRNINCPFGYQIVFSAERPVSKIPLLNVAFGQKGRCNMKTFQIPMLSTRGLAISLLGLCLLSGLDAPTAQAGFKFGKPVNLKSVIPIIDPVYEWVECFSSDGLEMYIGSIRDGGQGDTDLWLLRRSSVDEDWGPPENLGPAVNGPHDESMASISSDGLTLYFNSNRPGWDVYMTTRPTKNDPWGQAVNVGSPINTSSVDGEPWISPDNLELHFISGRADGYGKADIWVARRQTESDPWQEPVNLGPLVNSPYQEQRFSLSPDGLLLVFGDTYYASDTPRPGGYGRGDLYMTRRSSLSDPWQAAVNLGPIVNGPFREAQPRISWDGRTLYFWTQESDGSYVNWQAPIIPIVDFNGDGQADGKDVLCLASRWDTDDALCDIGPFAWGDGTVDLQDLIVLAEYLGKEVIDPTLIVHWALDETEGDAAKDSVSGEDSFVLGEPVWQPDGGMVGGALELDGIDDCIICSTSLNPADGMFSIVAWVKCGTPGQVIISQTNGSDWLAVDAEGKLMTELEGADENTTTLLSQVIITDEQWHRIGLVWDGSRRMLCVDGVIAAEDTQDGLGDSGNCLYIGVGKNYAADTFFSGLIDDVRIYNRVVSP
ncbi:MAG: protein kinase domain-containing protein [Planctomycetota bacterium]